MIILKQLMNAQLMNNVLSIIIVINIGLISSLMGIVGQKDLMEQDVFQVDNV